MRVFLTPLTAGWLASLASSPPRLSPTGVSAGGQRQVPQPHLEGALPGEPRGGRNARQDRPVLGVCGRCRGDGETPAREQGRARGASGLNNMTSGGTSSRNAVTQQLCLRSPEENRWSDAIFVQYPGLSSSHLLL